MIITNGCYASALRIVLVEKNPLSSMIECFSKINCFLQCTAAFEKESGKQWKRGQLPLGAIVLTATNTVIVILILKEVSVNEHL